MTLIIDHTPTTWRPENLITGLDELPLTIATKE
jgi:hypothetical protein